MCCIITPFPSDMNRFLQTYGAHYRALFTLGMPIVVGQLGVIILGFADTLMVGHHSTVELGAASFVNNMFNLCIIFSTGFSYGLTPVVGAFYGARRYAEAGLSLRCSLVANALVALLEMAVMTVLYLNLEQLGQPAELIPLIKPYYLVLLVSLLFVMLFNAFKQFTDGITDTRTAMWILLGGNAMNILGNYLLIYGKLGLPRPDLVVYLEVDLETSLARMRHRQEKTGRPGDIHERDAEYLRRCIETGERAAAHYGWRRVALRKDGEIREIDEKHEEIFSIVRGAL